MNAIFKRLDFSHSHFIEATKDPYCSLVFQSCPSIGAHKDAIRLNAHKDFGLLTILFFEEEGLKLTIKIIGKLYRRKKDAWSLI